MRWTGKVGSPNGILGRLAALSSESWQLAAGWMAFDNDGFWRTRFFIPAAGFSSSVSQMQPRAWLWMLAAACATLVFTPLILHHLHYFFVFAPATAWLCAIGATELESEIWSHLRASVSTRTTILLGTLAASLAGTSVIIHLNLYFDPYVSETGQLIKQHTLSEDKIIVWGMSWGSPFLAADRQGVTGSLSLTDTSLLSDPARLLRLKQLGYRKIVLINTSPYIVALSSVTGQHQAAISDLHQFLPVVARSWPVVFDSSQMLIVQIPD